MANRMAAILISKKARLAMITIVILSLLVIGFRIVGRERAPALSVITLDFAYYNPSSLVLKKFQWLETELAKQGVKVKWVYSAGSNRALAYLNGKNTLNYLTGDTVQFCSTASLSSLLSRANGGRIKAVYAYSQPEWTALVVGKDSPLQSVKDLRGKRIAATRGTDPYFFLLRTLREFGIRKKEIEIIDIQHADGRAALEQSRVDAWAGLDPHMASSERIAGSRLLYRNTAYNSYGFLNVSETFLQEHPEIVRIVIATYERARKWIISNPEAAAEVLANAEGLSSDITKLQLSRNNFSRPLISQPQISSLANAAHILLDEGLLDRGTDIDQVVNDLIDQSLVRTVIE